MNVLGRIFLGIIALVAGTGLVVLVTAIPDINRYRKIRQM